jgi:DNA polymerase-3 subunit epsilon
MHNADFDAGFLDYELSLMKHPQPTIRQHARILDTLSLARELHPGQRNSLDALCKRYEIDASRRDVHGALIDSELLAGVYLAMTGGQTALHLDDAEPERDPDAGDPSHRRRDGLRLRVVRASDRERAAHESLLDAMQADGECIYRDVKPPADSKNV